VRSCGSHARALKLSWFAAGVPGQATGPPGSSIGISIPSVNRGCCSIQPGIKHFSEACLLCRHHRRIPATRDRLLRPRRSGLTGVGASRVPTSPPLLHRRIGTSPRGCRRDEGEVALVRALASGTTPVLGLLLRTHRPSSRPQRCSSKGCPPSLSGLREDAKNESPGRLPVLAFLYASWSGFLINAMWGSDHGA